MAASLMWMLIELDVPTAGTPELRPLGARCTTQGPLFVAGIVFLIAATFGAVVWRVARRGRAILLAFFLATLITVFVAAGVYVEFFVVTVRDGCFAS
jgi:hypothetical protein